MYRRNYSESDDVCANSKLRVIVTEGLNLPLFKLLIITDYETVIEQTQICLSKHLRQGLASRSGRRMCSEKDLPAIMHTHENKSEF